MFDMKYIKELGTFEAGFSRTGTVDLVLDECLFCGEIKICIYSDASEGEYGGISICGDCAKNKCDDFKNEDSEIIGKTEIPK